GLEFRRCSHRGFKRMRGSEKFRGSGDLLRGLEAGTPGDTHLPRSRNRDNPNIARTYFESLAAHSPLFIGMCDLDYVPFYVNEAGRRLVGLDDLEHFQSTPVKDFFFPEDQDFVLNEFFPRVF